MGTGFDAWYPGYIDYMPMLQNINAYWTETALYRYATPHFYTLDDFPRDMRDLRPQSLYPSPWAGGWWRLRDAVDYMRTASVATLDYAAKYREELLYNRYQAGRNAIKRYAAEPPYAYVIPRAQRDPGAAVEMLRRLAFNGVRVAQLDRDVTLDGTKHVQGSWVIPMDQEFAELVRQLFDVQEYPDLREYPEGPPEQPYDAAGWTLPFQMDVNVVEVRTPLSSDARSAMRPVRGKPTDWRMSPDAPFSTDSIASGIVAPPAVVSGSGDRHADGVHLPRHQPGDARRDRLGERGEPDARRERRGLVLHVDDLRLPLPPRARDHARLDHVQHVRVAVVVVADVLLIQLVQRRHLVRRADILAVPVHDDVLSIGIDRRPQEQHRVVEDRFRLRLVGAREEIVGELDGVLRPGDLRRMQSAADVDEDLALRREAPGVRIREPHRVCEAL
jgi:hypothetical protein